jgi:hypothetical protein
MLSRFRIGLAVTFMALAAASAVDSASAGFYAGGDYYLFGFGGP